MAITTLYQFQADLKGLENLQKQIIKARGELKKLTKDTEEYKRKTAEIKSLGKQFETLKGSMGDATTGANNLNKAGNRLVNTFKSAAVAIASAFAVRAIVGGLKNIVTAFTDFEAQLAAVRAISGATAQEFETLEKTARDFGATTIFTATQVGKLQEEFARLGFSVEEINAATGATLNLAAATGESLAKSAQVAGSTLRAFGKDAVQTQNVVDVMAASFTSSALNLDKFTESMKFVAPVARTTGFTLEETTALMAQLADNGISGSIAGNALKNVFLRLGDESSKLTKRLGGTVTGLPQLIDAMKQLKEEGFGASDAIELLDKRSAPAFLALMQNIDGLQGSVDILNDAEDAASRMAAIRLDTLQGDMTILKSAAEGLSIALGDEFETTLREIIFNLTNFIQSITNSQGALTAIRIAIKGAAAALGILATRFAAIRIAKLVSGLKGLADVWKAVTTQTNLAALAQKKYNTLTRANIFVGIVTALATLAGTYFTLRKETTEAEMAQKRLNQALLSELDAIIALEEGTTARARAMRAFKGEFAEQLGLIDIELATQEELAELREVSINQEEKKLELASNDAEIKRLEKEIVLNREKAAQAEREFKDQSSRALELTQVGGKMGEQMSMGAVFRANTKAQVVEDQKQRIQRVKFLKQQNEELRKSLALQLQDTKAYQRLRLLGEETFRVQTKKLLDKQLIDFRKLNKSQQEEIIDAKSQELFEKSAIVKYFDMVAAKNGLFGEDLALMENNIDKFVEQTLKGTDSMKGFDVEARAADTDIQKLGIEVTLLDNFLNDLTASLKVGTKEFKQFTNTGFQLQKTKDLLKDLNKSIIDTVFDRIEQRKEAIRQEYDLELQGLDDQKALAETNIKLIQDTQKLNNQEIINSTILNNRSKFDTLKNLNAEELNIIKTNGDGVKELTTRLLGEMIDEEETKLEQNKKIRENILISNKNKMAQIRNEEIAIVEDGMNQQARILQDFNEQERKGLAKRLRLNVRLIGEDTDNKVKQKIREFNRITGLEFDLTNNFREQLLKRMALGEKFSEEQIRLALETQNEIANTNSEGTRKQAEAIGEAISQFGDFYNQAFSAFNTFASNQLALERQAINERFDMDKADREDALQAELDALGDNEEAKENVRRAFAQKEEDLEEIKQQKLRAIAKKEFQIQKANDIIQATINGALAVTKVLSQTGVVAPAVLPLTIALSAAQIAAIASQKFVGEDGGVIPEFAKGGMVYGASHAQGGVKFNAGGRVVELEGGEAVINKRSTAMFKPQLSAMNVAGGGVAFQDGGLTPSGLANKLQSTQVSPSQQMEEFAINIVSGINSKDVVVTESSITQTQTDVSTIESNSTLF